MGISGKAEIQGLTLILNSEGLHAEHNDAADVSYAIGAIGREAIIRSIEANYAHSLDQNPGAEVARPSVHVITLGSKRDSVLTQLGQYNRTALSRSIVELQPSYRDYWHAVLAHGFTPQVRRVIGTRTRENIALMLRNPETDPKPITPIDHLPAALGFVEPAEYRVLRPQLRQAHADHDAEKYSLLVQKADDEGHAAVDRQGATYGTEAYAHAQIGSSIALAMLLAETEGDSYLLDAGYEERLAIAEEYAYQMSLDEVSEKLLQEIERVRSMRTQPIDP